MDRLPIEIIDLIASLSPDGWRLAVAVSHEFALWSLTEDGIKRSASLFVRTQTTGKMSKIYVCGALNDWKNSPAVCYNSKRTGEISISCKKGLLHSANDFAIYSDYICVRAKNGVVTAKNRAAVCYRYKNAKAKIWVTNGKIKRKRLPAIRFTQHSKKKNGRTQTVDYYFSAGKCVAIDMEDWTIFSPHVGEMCSLSQAATNPQPTLFDFLTEIEDAIGSRYSIFCEYSPLFDILRQVAPSVFARANKRVFSRKI